MLTTRVGLEHRARPHRQAGADLHVPELLDPRRERRVESVGLADARSVLDPVAGAYERRAVSRRDTLARVRPDAPSTTDAMDRLLGCATQERLAGRRYLNHSLGARTRDSATRISPESTSSL